MTRSLVLAACVVFSLAACGAPKPTCAPRGTSYTVCSSEQVWECPRGPDDVVAFNQAVDSACQGEADPVACILKADYKMVDMTLKADCAGGGQLCKQSTGPGDKVASCELP